MKVEIPKDQQAKIDALLIGLKNGSTRVVSRAMNRTITQVISFSVKEIAKDLNLTQTRIRKDFTAVRSNFGNLTGRITSKGKPLGLCSFKGTAQRKKGVSVKIKVGGPRKTIKHAFIARTKHKRVAGEVEAKNVFFRVYKGLRQPVRKGFPYGALPDVYRGVGQKPGKLIRDSGPRIQDIYDEPKVFNPTMAHADERLSHNLNRELNYELSKL